jgi:rfaE bifunctional protein kinase chain/domain
MISTEQLRRVREKAKHTRAMVIGDAMLDKYIYGVVDRISPEAPVPVLAHKHTETKAGGSANVAMNLSAWGCKTSLVGLTGNDLNADLLATILDLHNIHHRLFRSQARPTTVKTRVVASSHHLLRIDEESTAYLQGQEENEVMAHILAAIEADAPDLIILEDYNKGFLTEKIISAIIGSGKGKGVFIAVDPKEKNFFSYKGANLFKPNLREAGQAAHRHLGHDDLGEQSSKWRSSMDIGTLAITLGSKGIFLQNGKESVLISPEKAIDVVDVCGAGDAVICALALGQMSGLNLTDCGSLANLTGAYVCTHSGVVSVDVEAIQRWI